MMWCCSLVSGLNSVVLGFTLRLEVGNSQRSTEECHSTEWYVDCPDRHSDISYTRRNYMQHGIAIKFQAQT